MNFDRVAPVYALLERAVFGRTLQASRIALLGHLGTPRSALLIGDGDGRFSAELLRRFPQLEIDVVEPSASMARIARRRSPAQRAVWHVTPIQQFEPGSQEWDLVVTQFVLDVLTEAEVQQLAARLVPRTKLWLVAEFQPGVFDWLLRIMYLFFRLTAGLQVQQIPDYAGAFARAGLQQLNRRTFWRGFIAAELYGAESPGR